MKRLNELSPQKNKPNSAYEKQEIKRFAVSESPVEDAETISMD